MSIEAMQQALEIIKNMRSGYGDDYHTGKEWRAMEALRQAIEQAEKQAPVAWMLPEYGDVLSAAEVGGKPGIYNIPLYTAPLKREWVGLTELEVKHYNNRLSGSNVAQEIESKLRERNT